MPPWARASQASFSAAKGLADSSDASLPGSEIYLQTHNGFSNREFI